MKYVILDEIELEILTDDDGFKKIFDTEQEAIAYAENNINAWQIVEIAWETNDSKTRDEIVAELVGQDIDNIRQGLYNNDIEFLENVLTGKGFVPYSKLSADELAQEYNERREQ